ncbi:acetyl-CoA carboxylase carboxyltransferase subunit alpha [Alicyclobacillus tolerans]|uniref:Acetyl-coenzyme A carboxylase carboxyl transferase subunit alpha n=1 Tax=Alicyclobacillus tolerans TaxID=90970 RepID=A0ABT9LUJ9_9BACL|nr:acetyl-CoA carboxylase carboxyltransferase subunit alpha [Alicyclobacillus tengchongensis]MDP9727946.1 acetyl-CoA carboxylase carboxyl transferase subunit alpha [Alicyclobacillus tengchongensis]
MATGLDFEQPIRDLESKIKELRSFAESHQVDLSDEIRTLEQRLQSLEDSLYSNLTPWQRVQIARQSGRPTTLEYVRGICETFVELHGDRNFRDDPAVVGGIGMLQGQPITWIGHQRGRDTKENLYRNFGMAHPEGYRKALRLMRQAEKFGRPVVFFIDTMGAYPGSSAEERGQSEAIATNLRAMAGLKTPTISVVTGEGASGGALGIGVTDRIYALEYSWYSVIAPESAAAILWRDSTYAEKAAEVMRITAQDLVDLRIADEVIPEPRGGAQKDPNWMISKVGEKIVAGLKELLQIPIEQLLDERYHKYRDMGSFSE